ncbi:MAG: c-type cytochrome [Deferrisomatales bacterium]
MKPCPPKPLLLLAAATLAWAPGPAARAHDTAPHGGPAAPKHQAHMEAAKRRVPEGLRALKAPPALAAGAALARSETNYRRHCAGCHGPDGRGDGPLAEVLDHPPANFHDLAHSATYGPGEKYWLITHGAPETGMPGFEGALAEDERWALVHWILRLQTPRP